MTFEATIIVWAKNDVHRSKMNNFEKLSVILVRLLFAFILLIGIGGAVFTMVLFFAPMAYPDRNFFTQMISTLQFVAIGTFGLIFSRRLGLLISKGL